MGIIALLVGLVVTIGSAVVRNGQRKDTQALLRTLDLAIQQFHDDAPLARVRDFQARYGGCPPYEPPCDCPSKPCLCPGVCSPDEPGGYPPDELEGFILGAGVPGSSVVINSAATANLSQAVRDNYRKPLADPARIRQQDTKAMVLAIRHLSPEATQILDRIDGRFKAVAKPGEYWDRNPSDGSGLKPVDVPLDYYVDSWGVPIEYFAVSANDAPAGSDLDAKRLAACRAFLSKNKRHPLLVSYGPDGPDQFSADFKDEAQDLVTDWMNQPDATPSPANERRIDNRFNEDNVYIEDDMAKRLRQN